MKGCLAALSPTCAMRSTALHREPHNESDPAHFRITGAGYDRFYRHHDRNLTGRVVAPNQSRPEYFAVAGRAVSDGVCPRFAAGSDPLNRPDPQLAAASGADDGHYWFSGL